MTIRSLMSAKSFDPKSTPSVVLQRQAVPVAGRNRHGAAEAADQRGYATADGK